MGDTVLERNLCFVDTPGYNYKRSAVEVIESVVRYVENQINKSYSLSDASNGELVNLLSGRGGTQVDLVFYMIGKGMLQRTPMYYLLICPQKSSQPTWIS